MRRSTSVTSTGARRSELIELKWADVDLKAGRATLRTSKNGDPRTPALLRIAEEEGLRGPNLRLFEAVGRVHPEVLGRTLPLNGAGVCGAPLGDLGFPADILRGFALLARAAGLVGHLAEEMRDPIGSAIYADVDRATAYDPPRDSG